ncbi:MAG: 16S rRNA (cytidine(1402)-2'-O)-methyltransferase [Bacteroidota bacterium]|jgi:16S rRNA (cytidine1402-2'-O)-methyltransferase
MSKLYLIPTPIGNLEDITLRALRILKECDLVLAEDTRVSSHLLKHYNIEKNLRAFHSHNEHEILEQITEEISSGKKAALISDAGTPGISDPGFLLVRSCIKSNIPVETLPGATAFVPALVNSGFPCNEFSFFGFLPQKKGRQSKWKEIAQEQKTIILYESPYRLVKLLEEIIENFGEQREVSVSRELTKLHEETFRGTAVEVCNHFKAKSVKGEIVVIIKAGNNS